MRIYSKYISYMTIVVCYMIYVSPINVIKCD